MEWQQYLEEKPNVMAGKAVFKGTRITAEFVLDRLGQGWSIDELTNTFPELTTAHLQAAQAYAAAVLRLDETLFRAG